jgi:4-carboxymuconolactone decarboxylase
MRLRHIRPEELTDEQRPLYETLTAGSRTAVPYARTDVRMTDSDGRLQGPFNSLLYNPHLGDALQELSRRIRFEGVLTPRVREIAVLILAEAERADFAWVAHAAIAETLQISAEQIEGISRGRAVHFDDPTEEAAARFAWSLVHTGDVDDETFETARAALGDGGVVELPIVIGLYRILAQTMRVFRVGSPPAPWSESHE